MACLNFTPLDTRNRHETYTYTKDVGVSTSRLFHVQALALPTS